MDVLAGLPRDAALHRDLRFPIPMACVRREIAHGEHFAHVELPHQRRQHVGRAPAAYDQFAAAGTIRLPQGADVGEEPRLPAQRYTIQDRRVEHDESGERPCLRSRVHGGIVVQAQIGTVPDEVHGHCA
jgi:hypothetical protein